MSEHVANHIKFRAFDAPMHRWSVEIRPDVFHSVVSAAHPVICLTKPCGYDEMQAVTVGCMAVHEGKVGTSAVHFVYEDSVPPEQAVMLVAAGLLAAAARDLHEVK